MKINSRSNKKTSIKKDNFFKKNLKLIIAISSIIVIFSSFWIYKISILKYSLNYLEENFGFEIENYNHKISINPTIEIEELFLKDVDSRYEFNISNITIETGLFSNKINVAIKDDIEFRSDNQYFTFKLDPKTKILLELSGEDFEKLSIKSPNIRIFNIEELISEMNDVNLSYHKEDVADNVIYHTDFSSNNLSKFISDKMIESKIIAKYHNSYKKSDDASQFSLSELHIDKFEVSNPEFSVAIDGKYNDGAFNFHVELFNKMFLFDSVAKSIEKEAGKIIAGGNSAIGNGFENEEDFMIYINQYKIKFVNILDKIAKNNQLTTSDKDVFDIVSHPTKIFQINAIDGNNVFKMFQESFADESK